MPFLPCWSWRGFDDAYEICVVNVFGQYSFLCCNFVRFNVEIAVEAVRCVILPSWSYEKEE